MILSIVCNKPIIKLEWHRIKRVVMLKCRTKIKMHDYFMCSNMLGLDMMANRRSCFFLLIFIGGMNNTNALYICLDYIIIQTYNKCSKETTQSTSAPTTPHPSPVTRTHPNSTKPSHK